MIRRICPTAAADSSQVYALHRVQTEGSRELAQALRSLSREFYSPPAVGNPACAFVISSVPSDTG